MFGACCTAAIAIRRRLITARLAEGRPRGGKPRDPGRARKVGPKEAPFVSKISRQKLAILSQMSIEKTV
jgi:hypothetical protein